MRTIKKPHNDVHASGKAAVDCCYANDFDAAVSALARMEVSSGQVLQRLQGLALQGESNGCAL